jgi:hypothetical protein
VTFDAIGTTIIECVTFGGRPGLASVAATAGFAGATTTAGELAALAPGVATGSVTVDGIGAGLLIAVAVAGGVAGGATIAGVVLESGATTSVAAVAFGFGMVGFAIGAGIGGTVGATRAVVVAESGAARGGAGTDALLDAAGGADCDAEAVDAAAGAGVGVGDTVVDTCVCPAVVPAEAGTFDTEGAADADDEAAPGAGVLAGFFGGRAVPDVESVVVPVVAVVSEVWDAAGDDAGDAAGTSAPGTGGVVCIASTDAIASTSESNKGTAKFTSHRQPQASQ